MKPIDIKSDSHAEYNVYFNDKDSKFKVGGLCKNLKMQKHFC